MFQSYHLYVDDIEVPAFVRIDEYVQQDSWYCIASDLILKCNFFAFWTFVFETRLLLEENGHSCIFITSVGNTVPNHSKLAIYHMPYTQLVNDVECKKCANNSFQQRKITNLYEVNRKL